MKTSSRTAINSKKVIIKKKNADSIFLSHLFIFFYVIIISVALYSGTSGNNLVHLDDDMMFDNLKTLHAKPHNILSESFTRDAMAGIGGDLYRPVQTFTLIFLYKMGNGNTAYFHLFQIMLHILASYLIYILLISLNLNKIKSLVLTLLYASHPLFVGLVCFIPSVGDQLLVVFALSSFICLILYNKSYKASFLALHFATFFIAILSKETALMLPAVFLLYVYFFTEKKAYGKNLIPLIGWIILPLLFLLLRNNYVLPELVASHNKLTFNNIFNNITYNLPSFTEFISKFFLPYKLSFLATYKTYRLIIGLCILCCFTVLFILKKIERRLFLFSVIWYFVFVFPPMMYSNPFFDYGEHRSFLPLIAFLLIMASVKINQKYYWFLLLLLPLLFTMTTQRKSDFKDPVSFYTAIVKNEPVAMAYLNRGAYYYKNINALKTYRKKAMDDFEKALEIKSDYHTALYNRAILKSEKQSTHYDGAFFNLEQAFADVDAAISAKHNYADAFYHRGYMKMAFNNDVKGAKTDMDSAIMFSPAHITALNNRGLLNLIYLKDTLSSFNDFNTSIKYQPIFNAQAYHYRGMHHFFKKDLLNACNDWEKSEKQGFAASAQYLKSYCQP